MTDSVPSFNLWFDPWITLEHPAGGLVCLGLWDTLCQAHELTALYDPSPLVSASIHRLLVAILQDALRPRHENDLVALWQAGQFPARTIEVFGRQYAHRFDLFSSDVPFLQSADLPLRPQAEDKTKLKTVAYLFPELPAGTAVAHYRHGLTNDPCLCSVCLAQGLVQIPAFATSGGMGIKPSINGVPPLYILPGGQTLFESLTASLVTPYYQPEVRNRTDDQAWWRHDPVVERDRVVESVGYVHSLTFPARRVRLHPIVMNAPCPHCGQQTTWGAQNMIFTMGEYRPKSTAYWFDPFVAYRLPSPDDQTNKLPLPIRPVASRLLWREFAALFLHAPESNCQRPGVLAQLAALASPPYRLFTAGYLYPFRVVGLRTDMKMKMFEWFDEGFVIPLALLSDETAADVVQQAVTMALSVSRIMDQVFAHVFGNQSGKRERHSRHKEAMIADFWRELALPFREFVLMVTEPATRHDAAAAWRDTVIQVACSILDRTVMSMGDDAAALRQQVQAQNLCRARLNKLRSD